MRPPEIKIPANGASDLTTTHHKGPMVWLRNKFLAGLALAAPLAVTIWILTVIYNLLHGISEPLLNWVVAATNEIAGEIVIDVKDPAFEAVTRGVAVLVPVGALIALGVAATNVLGVRVVEAMDQLLLRIPFLSFIYRSLKQVIEAFKGLGATQNFKRVVYIEYPVPGMRMLAFVTGQFVDSRDGRSMTTVFMPTAPNPMSGLLLVVDAEKVSDAPISIEEAMKMIFSAGLVNPETKVPDSDGPLEVPTPTGVPPREEVEVLEDIEDEDELLPAGLPKAEDFDSGDTELMASAFDVGEESSSKKWLKVPWGRK